ncbi:FecR family protein [Niabella sp.]|uniref:FecR family protein n=1 Tax=Niabella sp. TaxID=1962976 RepID=UPI0026033AB7|nr:FecR family protein [Niabella sp.]
MLNTEEFKILYEKFLRNECSEAELQVFIDAMASASAAEQNEVYQLFDQTWEGMATAEGPQRQTEAPLPVPEQPQLQIVEKSRGKKQLFQWVAAACLVVLLGAGLSLWLRSSKAPVQPEAEAQIRLSPESNRSTLTLADGSSVVLGNGADTSMAVQGHTEVLRINNGLVYKVTENDHAATAYNVLTTPRGGQYKLTLPDGSNAWLNAAASIRFPVQFTGASREVEVSGEVYFEVQKNPDMPFVVHAGPSRTEVLGTHFDVKAYADEPSVNVTLAEGSVRFSSGGFKEVLKPNQQARFDKQSGTGTVQEADMATVMAWTRGELSLSGMDLDALMREISRWYDVDVEIKGTLQQRQFQGTLKRNVSLQDVLAALDANGVDTKLEGRKLIVSAK